MEERNERIAQRRARSARIMARVREILPTALAGHPIIAAYIYGSVARGTVLPTSDLDVAVVVAEPMTLSPYEQLTFELKLQADIEDAARAATSESASLGVAEPREKLPEIDVRVINHAPLMVRGRIIQEGAMVYEGDHRARVAFEVATRKRYFDYAPVAQQLQSAMLEHIRRKGILNG